ARPYGHCRRHVRRGAKTSGHGGHRRLNDGLPRFALRLPGAHDAAVAGIQFGPANRWDFERLIERRTYEGSLGLSVRDVSAAISTSSPRVWRTYRRRIATSDTTARG